MRVTHLGPSRAQIGGMAAVLDQYAAASTEELQFAFVETHRQGSWMRRLVVFLRAVLHVIRTPREELGALHLHYSQGGSFVRKGILARLGRARGVPVYATLHGSRFLDFVGSYPTVVKWGFRPCRRVSALSNEAVGYLQTFGIPAVWMPNTVAVPTRCTPPSQVPPVVLFAGAVGTRKGVDVLLRAWDEVACQVPGARLLLAGPSEDLEVASDPTQGVFVLGGLQHAHLVEEITRCRVACLPSRAEAMPMFILEAMAAGRPVVFTPLGDLPLVVGDAGRCVPIGDEGALAAALVDLLLDRDLADELGARGRAAVLADHDTRDLAARLQEFYR